MATTSELGSEYRTRIGKVSREVVDLEMTLRAASHYIQRLESDARHAQALAEGIH